jgi:hypothetical protein
MTPGKNIPFLRILANQNMNALAKLVIDCEKCLDANVSPTSSKPCQSAGGNSVGKKLESPFIQKLDINWVDDAPLKESGEWQPFKSDEFEEHGMVLSIVGNSNDNLKPRIRNLIESGLLSVVRKTNAIVVTDGLVCAVLTRFAQAFLLKPTFTANAAHARGERGDGRLDHAQRARAACGRAAA